MSDKETILSLTARIELLEIKIELLSSQTNSIYQPIPYWFSPNFKMPVSGCLTIK